VISRVRQWRDARELRTIARGLGAGGLLAIAAVHANWARGSAWPAPTHQHLAQAVIGRSSMPPPRASLAVAAALIAAGAIVAGVPGRGGRMQRTGVAGVTAVLGLRGIVGLMGRMPHEKRSPSFARWNRRLYSPLCLLLAALCAASYERRLRPA
jgi:hypothetical protein